MSGTAAGMVTVVSKTMTMANCCAGFIIRSKSDSSLGSLNMFLSQRMCKNI